MHSNFLSALFPAAGEKRASFELIYSCHRIDKTYKCPFTGIECDSLKELFYKSNHPFMRNVIDCLPEQTKLDLSLLNKLIRDDRYMCFVVAEGRIDDVRLRTAAHQVGYVMCKKDGHLIASHGTDAPTMFTNHTLRFLQDEKNFVIDKLHHVFVTGVSNCFQPLFKTLCAARMKQKSTPEFQLLKFFACTFIGLSQTFNQSRNYVTVRNGDKAISTRAENSKYAYKPIWGTKWVTVVRTACVKPKSLCQTVGMGAVFYAKMRLLQSLHFFETTLTPDSYRLLNINTDSISIALARPTIRECVDAGHLEFYDRNVRNHMRSPPEPGYLKFESRYDGEWLVQYHGARTCKITTENVEEKKMAEDASFPISLTPYRHVYCSYVSNKRVLYWTIPFGANV
jgi:hypothetical protein